MLKAVRAFYNSLVLRTNPRRSSSSSNNWEVKKFYEEAHITQVAGQPGYYEVNLDQRKLRTPMGNVFQIPGDSMAHLVAAEWNSQQKVVKCHTMHLTSLCNTAIDNPSRRTRLQLVKAICHFLETDTLCFRMEEPENLVKFQRDNWDPILNWFMKRFDVELPTTSGLISPVIPQTTHTVIEKQLLSYSDWALVGAEQMVDILKSISLGLALIEHEIDVQKATYLSRLEQVYQTKQWGSVEWYHDITVQDSQARLAAATLFVQFCHDFSSVQSKKKLTLPI